MINFKDRIVENPNRYTISNISGNENDLIPSPGQVTEDGVPINRKNLMAIQGMESSKTTFNSDGSITETYATGEKITTFNADGSIKEKFTGNDGTVISKTTTFNEDGSITEEVD